MTRSRKGCEHDSTITLLVTNEPHDSPPTRFDQKMRLLILAQKGIANSERVGEN